MLSIPQKEPGYDEKKRAELTKIANWLAEQDVDRLLGPGHLGQSLCRMMTGHGRYGHYFPAAGRYLLTDGIDRHYLPTLFKNSRVTFQAGGAAMHRLLQHVAAECPRALEERGFFSLETQCRMLSTMARNGQNDAFVVLIKAGVGAGSCPRSDHPVNAAARYNYDLLLRLLLPTNDVFESSKLDIESISTGLLPEDDWGSVDWVFKLPEGFPIGGRSLVSHVCLNEENNHPHGEEILKEVLEKFDDPKLAANGKDTFTKETRLHNACRVGNLAAVRALLARGANVDVVDHWNRTPLLFVADGSKCGRIAERRGRCLEIARLLLGNMSPGFVNKAADAAGSADHGQTALQMARASANGDLVELLENHVAA